MTRLLSSSIVRFLIFCVGVIFFFSLSAHLFSALRRSNPLLPAQKEIATLENELTNLRHTAAQQHNAFEKERRMRNTLNVQKSDERVIQMTLPSPPPSSPPPPSATPFPIYQQWLKVLFDNHLHSK